MTNNNNNNNNNNNPTNHDSEHDGLPNDGNVCERLRNMGIPSIRRFNVVRAGEVVEEETVFNSPLVSRFRDVIGETQHIQHHQERRENLGEMMQILYANISFHNTNVQRMGCPEAIINVEQLLGLEDDDEDDDNNGQETSTEDEMRSSSNNSYTDYAQLYGSDTNSTES